MMRPAWDERIARANVLAGVYPFAAEVLIFYAALAALQRDLYQHARSCGAAGSCGGGLQSAAPLRTSDFREGLDLAVLLPRFPAFLSRTQAVAPAPLAALASQITGDGRQRWEKLLRNFWNRTDEHNEPDPETFFARAFLQPYAEFLAEQSAPAAPDRGSAVCPICGAEPVVAVLRPENLGARRSFICSLCACEWNFPRAVCAGCGEDRPNALSVYSAEQFEHVRVDACETCKTYIKTVDLTKNGLAIPVVDEIATLPLTLWAQEKGYSRLQPNLMAV